jgi:hypothetical protein
MNEKPEQIANAVGRFGKQNQSNRQQSPNLRMNQLILRAFVPLCETKIQLHPP